jgi:hypothetical protein
MTLIDDIKRDREAGTPGPWAVSADGCYAGVENGFVPFGGCGCCNSPWMSADGLAGQSDASRIARVPDMEAALIAADKLASEMERLVKKTPFLPAPNGISVTICIEQIARQREALAAYRKATGASE